MFGWCNGAAAQRGDGGGSSALCGLAALGAVDVLDRSARLRRDDVRVHASARSFLHHQIRSFAGTLKLVGEGKWQPRDVADALAAKDRSRSPWF